jgi:ketosteroid isomerase-like protein
MTALTLESLDRRLRLLEDIEAIRDLRMRYHFCINEQQWGGIVDLYTDDAHVAIAPVVDVRGKEAIDRFYRALPDHVDIVKQFIHNHMVEVRGDVAEGVSYLDARYGGDGQSLLVAGRFKELYRRTDAGWKISETLVELFFSAPVEPGWMIADNNRIKAFD